MSSRKHPTQQLDAGTDGGHFRAMSRQHHRLGELLDHYVKIPRRDGRTRRVGTLVIPDTDASPAGGEDEGEFREAGWSWEQYTGQLEII
jgi:hypothetical protein